MVIAIIAILAAMLVPAVSRALDKARMVLSLSNERQIGMAFMAYANDHENLLPPVKGIIGDYVNFDHYQYWFWHLYKYYDDSTEVELVPSAEWLNSVFYCPGYPFVDVDNWKLGYAMNIRPAMALYDRNWWQAAVTQVDLERIEAPMLTTLVAPRDNYHYGRHPTGYDSPPAFDWYNNDQAPFLFVDGHAVAMDAATYESEYSRYPDHPSDRAN